MRRCRTDSRSGFDRPFHRPGYSGQQRHQGRGSRHGHERHVSPHDLQRRGHERHEKAGGFRVRRGGKLPGIGNSPGGSVQSYGQPVHGGEGGLYVADRRHQLLHRNVLPAGCRNAGRGRSGQRMGQPGGPAARQGRRPDEYGRTGHQHAEKRKGDLYICRTGGAADDRRTAGTLCPGGVHLSG